MHKLVRLKQKLRTQAKLHGHRLGRFCRQGEAIVNHCLCGASIRLCAGAEPVLLRLEEPCPLQRAKKAAATKLDIIIELLQQNLQEHRQILERLEHPQGLEKET